MAALWRYFIASPVAEQNKVIRQGIARRFGYSAEMDVAAYDLTVPDVLDLVSRHFHWRRSFVVSFRK